MFVRGYILNINRCVNIASDFEQKKKEVNYYLL